MYEKFYNLKESPFSLLPDPAYLYMSRQISNYDILREPGTEGFWGENLIPSARRHLASETVTIGDRMYDRVELRKMALFPIKPGDLTIAPTIVEIETQRGIFFSKRRAVKRASLPGPKQAVIFWRFTRAFSATIRLTDGTAKARASPARRKSRTREPWPGVIVSGIIC